MFTKTRLSLAIAHCIEKDVAAYHESLARDFCERASIEIMKMLEFMGIQSKSIDDLLVADRE